MEYIRQAKRFGVIVGFILFVLAVTAGVYMAASKYLARQEADVQPGTVKCIGQHQSHQIVIQDASVQPAFTTATLCDQLVIINRDDTPRLVAFGSHMNHVPYDGVTERVLMKNQSLILTLNQLGTFHFHDHLHDEVAGDFTVQE